MRGRFWVVAVALSVGACGSGDVSNESASTASAPAVAASPTIASAKAVADAFAKAGLKVSNIVEVTPETDTNNLLGRPGQYTSKVFFYDARHPRKDDGMDEGENSIEVFATAEDAKTRHDYIAEVTKGAAFLTQYQLLRGNVLVRFDKVALPAEVEEYRKALSAAVPE